MDVLEHPCSAFSNVIVLQTVSEETKARDLSHYNRLRTLLRGDGHGRHFYAFANRHHRETHVEQEKGETPNDYNDRAIRAAAKWYQTELANFMEEQGIHAGSAGAGARAARVDLSLIHI